MPSKKKQTRNDKCLYCGRDQTEDPVGVKINWLKCDTCQKWMHLACFENATSTDGSVTPELWQFISADENVKQKWVFTCSQCSGADVSIPDQLETQNLVSRLGLRDMRVDPKFIKADVPQAPETSTVPVCASTVTPPTTTTAPPTSTAAPDPAAMYASSTTPVDLASMFKFFLEMDMKRQRERDDLEAKREQERAELEAKREELERKREEDRKETEKMFMRLLDNRDEKFKEMESKRLEQEQTLKVEQLKFERQRLEKEQEMEKQRLEHDREIEKRRLDKEEELNAERMKVEERLFERLQSGEAVTFTSSDKQKVGLKLPFVKIPTFSGDILKWMEFWDMFHATVDDNPDLSPVQKLSHLKACLEGPARESVSQLSMINDNYDVAVELLKKRYGDKVAIQERLFAKLQNLSISSMRLEDLRSTFHTVEQSLEQLRNLDASSCQETFLLNIIKKKFPPDIVVDVEKEQKADWTLKELMAKLENVISIYQRKADLRAEMYGQKNASAGSSTQFLRGSGPSPRGNFSPGPMSSNRGNFSSKPRSSAEALVATGGQRNVKEVKSRKNFAPPGNNASHVKDFVPNQRPRYPCVFCGSEHFPDECDKYVTPETRKNQLFIAKRCFMCLRDGHSWKECKSQWKVRPCKGCQRVGYHHFSLCNDWIAKVMNRSSPRANVVVYEGQSSLPESTMSPPPATLAGNHMASGDMSHLAVRQKTVMQTAKLPVQDPASKRILHANVFLDSGSNISWMSTDFCKRLGLKERYKKTISVKTFGTVDEKLIHCFASGVNLFTMDNQLFPVEVTVIDQLASPMCKPALSATDMEFLEANKKRYKLAPGATCQWESEFPVDIIIGQNCYWQLINLGEKAINLPSGLQLISSKFGYLLGGGSAISNASPSSHVSISHYVMSQPNEIFSTFACETAVDMAVQPNPRLEDFWELERIGILDSPVDNDDDKALERFNETIKFENGRYQSTWMWKSGEVDLPDNYGLALGRFKSLAKRFNEDRDLYHKYAAIIEEQLQKGIIEKVTGQTKTGPKQHYLPHHPVVTPIKETTKVRIVYDASAKVRKGANSLSKCLYRGPVILPDLCGLLIRFRTYPVAILADIEKAFLQIGLQTPDRDVTRFLWFRNPQNPDFQHPERDIQIYRFCRVAFGVICSPSILEATVEYHSNQVGSEVALNIADNIYVDNVLVGARNATDALQIYSTAKKIFSSASMNLREWTSNSKEFMDQIPEGDKAKMSKPTIKVLGLEWSLKEDEIYVASPNVEKLHLAASKREVLRALAHIFDPLGFFAPVTFHGKLFMEQLWYLNKQWDEPLSDELRQQWNEIVNILSEVSTVKIQRFLGILATASDFQLMIFCDASTKAYGAAVYLRYSVNDSFQTYLLFAKNRLAPKVKTKKEPEGKLSSMPKLELLGVLIGVRAANFVRKELKLNISEVTIWTDSACVLHWVKSKKPQCVFVENRLKEIRKSNDFNFRYVQSADNPADLITRGSTVEELKDNSMWWHGPMWLELRSDQWPETNLPEVTSEVLEMIESEMKPQSQISFSSREGPAEKIGISAVVNEARFSKFGKLIGATCYVLRFIRMKLWSRLSDASRQKLKFLEDVEIRGSLTVKERNLAEKLWYYSVQRKCYAQVFKDIQNRKRNPLQMQLGLKIDSDGLLRCHGRLGLADLSYEARFPVLLPSSGHFVTLLIERIHEKLYHSGTSHTLAQLRTQFWIPKGRKAVGNVIRKCLICKRHHGGPYQLQTMPDLPKERVRQARPFQYVGIDYLGPVYSKVGDTTSKAWICLFTCMTVRAIHLELVHSMDTKCFLECFRRFVARYGKPDRVISDNAPTFKLADRTLYHIWSNVVTSPEALEYFSSEKIEWRFITELAPWQGGFYERLVAVVKKCLRKALGRKFYEMVSLQTILEEIRAVVNTRPLTFVYNEVDGGRVVTPNDFIGIPDSKIGIPPSESDQEDPYYVSTDMNSAQKLSILWREQQNRVDKFWEMWREEYLPSLRERFQTEHRSPRVKVSGSPRPGEIVLVYEDKQPRGSWPLAKVIEVRHGHDDAIRSVKLRLANGNELNRSVNFLYPLEVSHDPDMRIFEENLVPRENDLTEKQEPETENNVRPVRKASEKAHEMFRRQLQDNESEEFMHVIANEVSLIG